jgi:CubicO group peptidase (beta-lactamase class C family)
MEPHTGTKGVWVARRHASTPAAATPHPRKSSPTQCAATRYADRSWGYGVAVNHDGSWGWDGGLGSSFWIHPELDLSVIVLTQRMWDSPDLPLVHREIGQAAIDVFT